MELLLATPWTQQRGKKRPFQRPILDWRCQAVEGPLPLGSREKAAFRAIGREKDRCPEKLESGIESRIVCANRFNSINDMF